VRLNAARLPIPQRIGAADPASYLGVPHSAPSLHICNLAGRRECLIVPRLRGSVTEGRRDRRAVMSETESQEEKKDTKSPIVIGICSVAIFALATAMNYGGLFHSAQAAPETVAPATTAK
jgi:hypothetical protein